MVDDSAKPRSPAGGLVKAAVEARFSEAVALHRAGRLAEAVASYAEVIGLQPDHAAAGYNRGLALQVLGRLEEAVENYRHAIGHAPGNAMAHNNLGNTLLDLKRADDALASFDRAIALRPGEARYRVNRGLALDALNRQAEALASFDAAIGLQPDFAEAHFNRANALQKLMRVDEALASYDRAIAIHPAYAEAYCNRGNALQKLNRMEAAVASFEQAVRFQPDNVTGHVNRGNALQKLMRLDEARASYERAVAVEPGNAEAQWNLSLCRLLMGDFARGWPGYEWRWNSSVLNKRRRDFAEPLWLGQESLAGRTILLHAEQGLGDTLQFCRYVPLVRDRGARVILEVPAALAPLLRQLDGVAQLVVSGATLPSFDFHCPLPSLPLAFGTELATIPASDFYLAADPDKVATWRQRLGAGSGLDIGLVWRGSATHANDHNRSLTLDALLPLLPRQCRYVSLQKEVGAAERQLLQSHGIAHFGEELADFADTAALCASMDLVISVDTSVAHLAGALGRPVWIMLPFSPDWRWLLDRDDSPWYPGARLFRQHATGDWSTVFAQVRDALLARLSEPGPAARP